MERNQTMKTIILSVLIFFFSYKALSQWVQTTSTPQGSGITGMAINVYGDLVVSTGSINGGQPGGIRMSVDGGENWNNYVDCYIARTLTSSQNHILYASIWYYPSTNEGIYRSFSGNGWIPLYNFPSSGNNIFSIATANDTFIYAGTRTGILRSTNYGVSFAFSNNGIPANSWVWDIAIDSTGIVGAATSNGVFISTNQGTSWQQTTGIPSSDTITSIGFHTILTDGNTERVMFAFGYSIGNQNLIFEASANTTYLAAIINGIIGVNNLDEGHCISPAIGAMEFIWTISRSKNPGQPGGGVHQSTNNGQSFTPINEGLPNNPNGSAILAVNTTNSRGNSVELYCGLFENSNNGAKVFKRTVPIGIQQISSEVPTGFSLSQNYPNPFNPVTNIKFQLPKAGFVKLAVFDALGRNVAELVNQQLKHGTYNIDFEGNNLPSGVYFYKLETESFTQTKKMILIK